MSLFVKKRIALARMTCTRAPSDSRFRYRCICARRFCSQTSPRLQSFRVAWIRVGSPAIGYTTTDVHGSLIPASSYVMLVSCDGQCVAGHLVRRQASCRDLVLLLPRASKGLLPSSGQCA